MKLFLIAAWLLVSLTDLVAQPDWSVTSSNFSSNMNVTGIMRIDGEVSLDTNDMVGAFINDECRGVAQPSYVNETGDYIVYLTIFNNQSEGDVITFKLYKESKNSERIAINTLVYSGDELVGNINNPHVFGTNNFPTDIDYVTVNNLENQPIGTAFAAFSTTDSDLSDTHTYTLLYDGAASFELIDDTLFTTEVLDYEVTDMVTVEVSTDDGNGGVYTEIFNLSVLNEVEIEVEEEKVEEPTTISSGDYVSPNGDGKNDVWKIPNVSVYKEYSLSIADDYGQVVYQVASNYNNDWNAYRNGKALPDGNYYYQLKNDNTGKMYTGIITVVK
jgi:gliding motility-associated-like protein